MQCRYLAYSVFGLLFSAQASEVHEAARNCDPQKLSRLLASGISANTPDELGNTPLHVAVRGGQTACIKLLLPAGADPRIPNHSGVTSWQLVREASDRQAALQVLRLLLNGSGAASSSPWEKEPLHEAARRAQPEVVSMLLKLRADPNSLGKEGYTPLHIAALKGHASVVEVLLMSGARVDIPNVDGDLPLHDAAVSGSVPAVLALLRHGASTSATSKDGNTALHYAATWGRPEALTALLDAGSSTTAKNAKGRTPLDEASLNGHESIVALLKAHAGRQ